MISLIWMVVICIGFTTSGVLAAYGELKVAGAFFAGAWLWMSFPKVVMGTLGAIVGFFRKAPKAEPAPKVAAQ